MSHTDPAPSSGASTEPQSAAGIVQRVLTAAEAAALLNIAPRTLRRMRAEGGGPVYVHLSAQRVGYLHRDITAWLEQRRQAQPRRRAAGGKLGAAA